MVTFPLSGRWRWRGRQGEMFWTAGDGHLASGEKLDQVLAAAHQPAFLYVDRKRERITLPSQDATGFAVDAYLLIANATAMQDRCGR